MQGIIMITADLRKNSDIFPFKFQNDSGKSAADYAILLSSNLKQNRMALHGASFMDPDKRLRLLKSHIDRMTPLSPTVTKVITICNQRDTSPADISRVISVDPVLMGKVLRLINSAYYGLPQKVTSIVRAIIMLGINTVKNMLLSTAVMSTLGNRKNFNALEMMEFWKHSLAVGVTAKLIAKRHRLPPEVQEEYFIGGLLHDIGKIPLNNRFSEEYYQALDLSEDTHQPLYVAENQMLGTNHAQVGKLIAENWNLGDDIADTISHHHSESEYEGENRQLVYAVTLSDYLVNTLNIGYSGNSHPMDIDKEVLLYLSSQMDVTYDNLRVVVKDINLEIEKAQVFLKMSS
jgi:putative nucleotidyltransferase with HDIG domain